MKAVLLSTLALAGCAQLLGLDQTSFEAGVVDVPSVCDGAPACTSSTGRSVCGQLFGTGADANQPFRVASSTGERCVDPNTERPCGLQVAAYPLATYFDGTRTGKIDGQIDDCGRFVVGDVDAGIADLAIEFTGAGFQTTTRLLLGRTTIVGEDRDLSAYAVSTDTVAAWATQMSATAPPETTTGYLIEYTRQAAPLSEEQVAINGMTAFGPDISMVPWAGYFVAGSVFGNLDPALPSTSNTGTAFAVLPAGSFGLEGFHQGSRCTQVMGLQQIANTLIHVHLDDGC